MDSCRIFLPIETSAFQVTVSLSFLSLLQRKYLRDNPDILSLHLVLFYYLSRTTEFPQGFLYLFFSSFHYKLRLLIPLLTTVSKYSFCRGKFNKSGYEKCSVLLKPQSQKFKSLLFLIWRFKWTFFFLSIFGKICNQCNKQLTNNLWMLLDFISLCFDWLYMLLSTEISTINSQIEFYFKRLLHKF